MTQNEFIKKLKTLFKVNEVIYVSSTDENNIGSNQMLYINNQDNEIINDYVESVGFDSDGNFFIDFEETQCTAYEEDLECNSNDAWDYLWDTIYELFDPMVFEDTNEHNFKVGDKVYWDDPAITDYPEDEREDLLNRRFVIIGVDGYDDDSIIHITDCYTDAEVYASELRYITE
jgi:hypothetical protein